MTGLLLIAWALSACSGLLTSDAPPRQEYLLMPLPSAATNSVGDIASLTLSVSAIPGLDSNRILALGSDARLNPYGNARWTDHLPEVLNSVMRRSLAGSGLVGSVESAAFPDGTDGSVSLETEAFYGVRDGSGDTRTVQIRMAGTLHCAGSTKALRLESSQAVPEQRLASVVAAFQSGLDDVTRQLLTQLRADCA